MSMDASGIPISEPPQDQPVTPAAAAPAPPDPSPPAPVPSSQRVRMSGRILVVEDGPDVQRLLSFYLKKAGAQVTVAENGRIACEEIAQAAAQGRPFDLVLMDMQMPELDGYRATARLRAQGHEMPIVAFTADGLPSDRDKCLRSGCNDYLKKPAHPTQLLMTLARHLAGSTAPTPPRDALDAIVGQGPPAEDATAEGTTTESQSFRSPLSDDPETVGFVANFVRSLPAQAEQLVTLAESADVPALCNALHGLKGTGGFYGFPVLTDRARVLEERLRSDPPAGEALLEQVNDLVRVLREIESQNADLARRADGAAAGEVGRSVAAQTGPVVLVVEDMVIIRDPIAAALRTAGYQTLCASDGSEALDAVRKAKHVDLILLDVMMPRMDGLQFLWNLRRDPAIANIPVILLSSAERKEDILAAAKFGVCAYLLKSQFSLAQLLSRVETQLAG